jgi:hypothetical protein
VKKRPTTIGGHIADYSIFIIKFYYLLLFRLYKIEVSDGTVIFSTSFEFWFYPWQKHPIAITYVLYITITKTTVMETTIMEIIIMEINHKITNMERNHPKQSANSNTENLYY